MLLLTYQNEPFSETKKRLQTRLGVQEKDFSRYRFNLVSSQIFRQPTVLEDGVSIYDVLIFQTIYCMTTSGQGKTPLDWIMPINDQIRVMLREVLS